MSELVLLRHKCPVCQTSVDEVYQKTTTELKTYSREVTHYRFIKSLDKGKEFDRFHLGGLLILICPGCGVLLSGEHWETEEAYTEEAKI